MPFAALADAVLVIHFAFILFAVLGGVLVLRSPRWAWLHVPTAAWAALVALAGWPCPLTPVEQWLRRQAGEEPYSGSFIEHYLLDVIYPPGLTREAQIILGLCVLLPNAALYGLALMRRRR